MVIALMEQLTIFSAQVANMPTNLRSSPSATSLATTLACETGEDPKDKRDPEQVLVETLSCRRKRTLLFLLPLVVAAAVTVATLVSLGFPYDGAASWGCNAAGNVWVFGVEPSIWSGKTALYPTLPVFRSTFSAVKALDVCWDLLIGHGYGGLCGIVVYNVFRTVMVDIMRTELLPHKKVLAMEYSPVSISSGITYTKTFVERCKSNSGLPRPSTSWTTLLLIFAVAYTLAAPTWLSAMTSYQNVMQPFLPTEHGLVTFDQIKGCFFVVVDGHRIGLEDNACITRDNVWAGSIKSCKEVLEPKKLAIICLHIADIESGCRTSWHYFGRGNCEGGSVIFRPGGKPINLPPPILKIHSGAYTYNNQSVTAAHLAKIGKCQPDKDQYEWGFSFILLFSFMVATIVMTSCVSLTWYKYQDHVWPQQVDMMFGKIRTALIVAASVKEQVGEGMYEMIEEELNANLARSDGIGHVHARSKVMVEPGPYEERRWKFEYDLPVGSDGYNAYLQRGLESMIEKRTKR